MKTLFTFAVMALFCGISCSQELHTELYFKHNNINENQMEINFISLILQQYGLTIPSPEQEKAIEAAHEYYYNHKEEIDINLKANELLEYRSARKANLAGMWAQALGAVSASISGAAVAAQQLQNVNLQDKKNTEAKIQSFLARHSTSRPQQYTQNFGNTPVETTPTKSPRVTTSNGLEEPLPSAKSFESGSLSEKMGVKVENGVSQSVRVRVNGDRLEDIWNGSPLVDKGNKSWYPVGQNGYHTDYKSDGELSKLYKYKVMINYSGSGLTTIYY